MKILFRACIAAVTAGALLAQTAFAGAIIPNITKSAPVTQRAPIASDDYTQGYYAASAIDEIVITNAGGGCTSAPTVTIAAPGGSGGTQATAHAILTPSGTVGAIRTDNPGMGYTAANPTVTLSGGGCTTAPTATAYSSTIGALWNSPQGLFQIQQHFKNAAVWTKLSAPSLPLDSIAHPVTAAAVSAGGSGYAVNDTITLPNGTVLKVATVNTGAVATVTVQTAGSWPCMTSTPQAQVSTSGAGTGATFTLTIHTALAAYGTKRMSICWTGNAADVVRASDNNVLTVGFVNNVIDVSALQQFCAGTTCTVKKWYDQSGNGQDATQNTVANQFVVSFDFAIGGAPGFLSTGNGQMSLPFTIGSFNNAAFIVGETAFSTSYIYSSNVSFGPLIKYNNTAILSSVNNLTSVYPATYSPTLLQLSQNGTTVIGAANDFEQSLTAAISNVNSSSNTLGNSGGNSLYDFAGAIFLGRTVTTAERQALRASFDVYYGVTPQARELIIADGDSRTVGVNATNEVTYPSQMAGLLKWNQLVANVGVGGTTSAQRLSGFWGSYVAPVYGNFPGSCMITEWIGYNDLNSGGQTPAQVYANLTTYAQYAHSLGCKLALATEPEGATGALDANSVTLSNLIRANSAGADYIVDLAADPIWNSSSNYTTQTFNTYPHPTSFGYGFVANDFANVLNAVHK